MNTARDGWNPGDAEQREAMLTAYALGELDAAAAASLERQLGEDPQLRAELEAIRGMAVELEAAFAAEAVAAGGLGPARRATIDAGPSRPHVEPATDATGGASRWWIRRTLPLVAGGLAVAASLGVAVVLVAPGLRPAGREQVAIESGERADVQPPATLRPSPEMRSNDVAATGVPEAASHATAAVAGADAEPFDGAMMAVVMPEPMPKVAAEAMPEPSQSRVASRRAAPMAPAAAPSASALAPDDLARWPMPEPGESGLAADGERYEGARDNPWRRTIDAPLSTFSIDVDTASYANVRRMLQQWGQRPPREAVRIEEFINAFDYRYPVPAADAEHPFSVSVDAGPAPWAPAHRLVRIGLQGHELSIDERPAANLVFLVDASGSMRDPQKMPLVKASLRMLLTQLGPSDRVAIVTYARGAELVLDSTAVTDTGRAGIASAIDGLSAGGSTNGEGGIRLAYRVAAASMIPGGANRVVLCTDGDFNVGVSGPDELQQLIEQQRRTGVFLNVVGFGTGNLRDDAMERISNHGNGVATYIDSLPEAEKVFVRGAVGSLVTIARDVKVQVDFNPGRVQAYRLIGYANRMLRDQDFNDDRVDAGEIGAGHSVTALYEIVPVGVEMPGRVDASKYRRPNAGEEPATDLVDSPELLTVRVRYQPPAGGESVRFDTPFTDAGATLEQTAGDFRFAAAVAGFGMLLRQSPDAGALDWAMVRRLAEPGLADDPHGDRREFLALVRAAEVIGD